MIISEFLMMYFYNADKIYYLNFSFRERMMVYKINTVSILWIISWHPERPEFSLGICLITPKDITIGIPLGQVNVQQKNIHISIKEQYL